MNPITNLLIWKSVPRSEKREKRVFEILSQRVSVYGNGNAHKSINHQIIRISRGLSLSLSPSGSLYSLELWSVICGPDVQWIRGFVLVGNNINTARNLRFFEIGMDGELIVQWLGRQRDEYWREWRWTSYNNRIKRREGISLGAGVLKVYNQLLLSLDSLHERGLYCGDLLGSARVIDGSRVVIAENVLAYADLSKGICKDLRDFQVLVLAAEYDVHHSIRVLPSWSSHKFHQLYQSIPRITATVEEFRYFTFFVLHNPLFMDVKAKYLFFRKVLTMYENHKVLFRSSVSLSEMRGWVQVVSSPELLAIKNYTRPGETVPVNEKKYMTDAGCIDFFRNSIGHIRDNIASGRHPVFIDDSTILFMLEDDLPMAIPIWFYSLFKFLGAFVPPPACEDLCDNHRLKEFLERTISFCA